MKWELVPNSVFRHHWEKFLQEDGVYDNAMYLNSLTDNLCKCELRCKSRGVIAGLPFFFDLLQVDGSDELVKFWEGKSLQGDETIKFETSFRDALVKERVLLNLLSHLSSIATKTSQVLQVMGQQKIHNIKLLDTRKTTPGLRFFERYAFELAGGQPHRSNQTDQWMIKDNHKQYYGGLTNAWNFFHKMSKWAKPIMVEIHDELEFEEAIKLGVQYVMLDNFPPETIKKLAEKKPKGMILEVSGGIQEHNILSYMDPNVDGISMGTIYSQLPKMDFSLKLFPRKS